jgi:hypothetical protein
MMRDEVMVVEIIMLSMMIRRRNPLFGVKRETNLVPKSLFSMVTVL